MYDPASNSLYLSDTKLIKVNSGQNLKIAIQVSGGAKTINVGVPSELGITLVRRNV